MIELLLEYTETTHVSIKKNTFNGADAFALEKLINEHPILKYRNIEIINEQQKKNKDDKISTAIPYVNKGQIVFAEEDDEFTKQVVEFLIGIDKIEEISIIQILDRRSFGL